MRVNVVRFAPRARNAWHMHAVGQTLHVTEGIGRIQARGGDVLQIPRRRHDPHATRRVALARRGARPFMTHLAIWEAPVGGAESEWGDQITGGRVPGAGEGAGAMTETDFRPEGYASVVMSDRDTPSPPTTGDEAPGADGPQPLETLR